MGQYRLDDHRVFNASDHLRGATAEVSTSMLNTRLSRCAQVMATWRCTGVCSSWPSAVFWQPLPRFAGVTRARCLLFGANTPWNRVRLTLGLGTRAASLAMKSTGSKMTCVVPSRTGVFSSYRTCSTQRLMKSKMTWMSLWTDTTKDERIRDDTAKAERPCKLLLTVFNYAVSICHTNQTRT